VRVVIATFFVVGATGVGFACGGSSIPNPPYTRQPTSALMEIPYPPPPARVEIVPKQPRSGAVWVDGEWVWQTRRWRWRAGRWVMPPREAKFAPWTTVRDNVGTLYFAAGTWRDASGREIESPPSIAVAEPSEGVVVNRQGDPEPSATTLPTDAGIADAHATTYPGSTPAAPVETPLPVDAGTPDAGRDTGEP
jgi:hypothetical protein